MVVVNLVAGGKQSDLLPGSLSRTCRPQRPAPFLLLAFLLPAILLASGCGGDDSNSTRTPTPAVTAPRPAPPPTSPTTSPAASPTQVRLPLRPRASSTSRPQLSY